MAQGNQNGTQMGSSASNYSGDWEDDFDLERLFDFDAYGGDESDAGAPSSLPVAAPPAPSVQPTPGSSVLTNAAPQTPPADSPLTNSTASADDPEDGGDSGEVADSGTPGNENATASASALEREPASPLPNDKQSGQQSETKNNAPKAPPSVTESTESSIDEADDTKELKSTTPEGAAAKSAQDGNEAEDPTPTLGSGHALKHKETQKRARGTEDDEEEGKQVAARTIKRTRTARSNGKEAIVQPTVTTQSTSTTSTPTTTTTDALADAHSAHQSQIMLAQGLEREWMRNAMNATITIYLPPCPNPALAGNPYAFTTMMFPAGRTAAPPYTARFAPPVAAGPSTPAPVAASSTVGTTASAARSTSEDVVFIDVTPQYVNASTQPGTQTASNITGPVTVNILSPNRKKRTSIKKPEDYHPMPNPP